MRKLLLAATVAATALMLGMAVVPASAGNPTSWYVCKWVGTPGNDETLQTGDNPIFVNENSIMAQTGKNTVAIGDAFADAQTHSRVIAGPYAHPGIDPEPVCPTGVTTSTPPPPPPPTTTQPPPPPPTTTAPPPPPPTTTQPPPPPSTTVPPVTTTVVPPPTTTVTVPPNPQPVPCKGSISLGPWYGDPRINITLTGAGHFVVSGGVQRFSNQTTFDVNLACGQVLKIGRYKVERGHYLTITQDSVLVTHIKPPRIH